jgi:hypothetical protein
MDLSVDSEANIAYMYTRKNEIKINSRYVRFIVQRLLAYSI